ncbi:MAG TPA: hypothetical protein VN862_07175 [Candidatus Acidoferrales bacterium]|nr:hypothetical protein [Candidatus Acidoferrales bacterium]
MGRALTRDPRKILSVVRPALMTGLVTGLLFSILLTSWLFVANRIPTLEPYAVARNVAAAVAALLVAALPFFRFRRSARALALSGLTTWAIVTLCYSAWCLYFEQLGDRMGVFRLFVMGAVLYGLAAALVWVSTVIRGLRRTHLVHEPHHRPVTPQ